MKVKANELKKGNQLITYGENVFIMISDGIRLNQDTIIYKAINEYDHQYYLIKEELPLNGQYKGYFEETNKSIIYWLKKIGSRFKKEIINNMGFERIYYNQEMIKDEYCLIEGTRFACMNLQQEGAFLSEIIQESLLIEDILDIIISILKLLINIHKNCVCLNIHINSFFFPHYEIGINKDYSDPILLDYGNIIHIYNNQSDYLDLDDFYKDSSYSPPEIELMKDPIRITPATDLYLVGRLFLFLLTGNTYVSNGIDRVYYDQSILFLTKGTCKRVGCSKEQRNMIRRVLTKVLSNTPEERYQSAQEMLEDIQKIKNVK